MQLTHLKAAYQLAEMHHKADPKNEAKQHAYQKALSEYEQAAEAARVETEESEPVNDQAKKEPVKSEPSSSADGLSIEELEALLKQKKDEKKAQAEAERKAAKEATEPRQAEAAKLAAKAGANGSTPESEDSKKNENPS